jgi:hypothetical protein
MNPTQVSQVISFRALRNLIGLLGMLLPWACWLANIVVNRFNLLNNKKLALLGSVGTYKPGDDLKSSISHFYYTAAGPLFIGILVTVSIFLFCYRGYSYEPHRDRSVWLSDRRVTFLAAIFALGIVIFPVGEDTFIPDSLFIFTATGIIGQAHYVFAALFFIAISVLCLVNFRRKETQEQFGRDRHDRLYLICGWVMLGSMAFIVIYHQLVAPHWAWNWPVTFVFETVALTAFGIAWLVKGKADEMIQTLFD